MGKLIRFEIRKILKSRFFVLIALLFLLSELVLAIPKLSEFRFGFVWMKWDKNSYDFYYSLSDEELEAFCKAMEEKYGADVFTNPMFPPASFQGPGYFGDDQADINYIQVRQAILMEQGRIDDARAEVLRKAGKLLETAEAEGDTYRIRELGQMIRIYAKELPPVNYPVRGWTDLIGRFEILIPILLLSLLIGGLAFSQENDYGTKNYLRTTMLGDHMTVLAKIAAVVILSLTAVALCNLVAGAVLFLEFGFMGGSNPVQRIYEYILSPLPLKIWQFCLMKIGAEIFTTAIFSVWMAAISFVSKKTWMSYLIGGVFLGAALLVHYFMTSAFRHVDLLSIVNLEYYFSSHYTANILGFPVNRWLLLLLGWTAATAVLVFLPAYFTKWQGKERNKEKSGEKGKADGSVSV